MRSIGIRAAPTAVTFVVYDSTVNAVVNVQDIRLPIAFAVPDRLKYLRNNLLDILREYEIERAGVRVMEPTAQQPNFERIQIEGVVQEAFASCPYLKAYYVGQIASISARIGVPRDNFKPLVEGEREWNVEGWQEMKKEQREALLCAIGACRA
jgi:hypothetical protein